MADLSQFYGEPPEYEYDMWQEMTNDYEVLCSVETSGEQLTSHDRRVIAALSCIIGAFEAERAAYYQEYPYEQ